ncbi:6-phosphogluconolactonase [Candidatus Chlorohelix allophototropha]|uniref:6-phosphogluconolactonase n=2 Tax=Candidatus Chlorohelix allophototropha TaxID=3003348 RepID=A0ABY9B4V2_9CHLR|nr:6-phosphogluconolactonase [Chloroflexota bacterium L227-S17]
MRKRWFTPVSLAAAVVKDNMHNIDPQIKIQTFENLAELSKAAAERLAVYSADCIAQQGRFTIALAGGNTPRELYKILAQPPIREQIDWFNTYLFFGDERCVPPNHPDSNYRMVQENLLDFVGIPFANIFRMEGENLDPEAAATNYANLLQEFFELESGDGPSPENFPKFDLILLGMGPDGHTASLFPGTSALQERGHPVAANFVPKLNANRLTLTAPTINRAEQVWFLVVGEDKAPTLKRVLEGDYQPQTLPSQLVKPNGGRVYWFVDRAAASQLDTI